MRMTRLDMNGGDRHLPGSGGSAALWLQRALFTILGAGLLVLAFFFLTVALIAGAFLALVLAARWWWFMRRIRAAREAAAPLEGQYTVLEDTAGPERRIERSNTQR
jgi:membrane protein implicated in regulation of membrane protease activity